MWELDQEKTKKAQTKTEFLIMLQYLVDAKKVPMNESSVNIRVITLTAHCRWIKSSMELPRCFSDSQICYLTDLNF